MSNRPTLIVNFFGGPGAGKSTMAARVFADLKEKGVSVEQITEYAKDLTWQKSFHVLKNQVYVFGKQQHRIWRLDGSVDLIISDSPLPLCVVYGETSPLFKELVWEEHFRRPCFDIYLNRVTVYDPNGRSQTEQDAIEIDNLIKLKYLERRRDFDLTVDGTKSSTEAVVKAIENHFNSLTQIL